WPRGPEPDLRARPAPTSAAQQLLAWHRRGYLIIAVFTVLVSLSLFRWHA
ncbi:hypothetical protein TorRG33x02_184330, partial [Trema orientale]